MSTITDDLKAQIIQQYLDAEPTPESSVEIVKDLAEEHELSANAVRQILVLAKVYVKKDVAASTTTNKKTTSGEGSKRVSKESQIEALKAAITAKGGELDDDILSKLTGKAAAYFTKVLTS